MMTSILLFLYLFDQIINRAVVHYKGVITPVYQREQYDCGLACASTLISCYGNFVSLNRLRRDYKLGASGLSLKSLAEILTSCGIPCCCKKVAVTHFHQLAGPVIFHFNQSHYVVFLTLINEEYYYFDPARGFCYASANTWQDMASGFVLLPLHRASVRQGLKKKLTSNLYCSLPFYRYIYHDFLLSITLWFAASSFPDHRVIIGFCYAIITVNLLRINLTHRLYRLRAESSYLPQMTRYLFHYRKSLFRRLSSSFFYIYFALTVFFLFSSLYWFSTPMLISGAIMIPLMFWAFFLHRNISDRHYIKRTHADKNSKQFKYFITTLTLIRKVSILLLIVIFSAYFYCSPHQFLEVLLLFLYVALSSSFLLTTYLDFKELLFILNAYDVK